MVRMLTVLLTLTILCPTLSVAADTPVSMAKLAALTLGPAKAKSFDRQRRADSCWRSYTRCDNECWRCCSHVSRCDNNGYCECY